MLSKTALFSLDVTKPNRFQQAVAVEGLLVNSEVVNKVVKEDVNEDVKEEVDEDVNEQRCWWKQNHEDWRNERSLELNSSESQSVSNWWMCMECVKVSWLKSSTTSLGLLGEVVFCFLDFEYWVVLERARVCVSVVMMVVSVCSERQSADSVQGRLTHAQALDTGPVWVTRYVCFDDEYGTSYTTYQ